MKSHVLELIKKGESETVEFKGSRSPSDSLLRAVCGFLNQQGGFLLWGVDDKGQPTGIDNAEKKAEELTSRFMSDINPRPFLSVSVIEVKQVSVIVVRVPPGSDKPYSVNRLIWVRIGSATMRAGGERSADLVKRGAMDLERWEREPIPGFSIGDCDIEELSKTRREIKELFSYPLHSFVKGGEMDEMPSGNSLKSSRKDIALEGSQKETSVSGILSISVCLLIQELT